MWEAVREILQNAIDYGNPDISSEDGVLEITSYGVTLSPQSLLLGNTTKRNDNDSIGQFGEGYKLACLVFCRLGIDVVIRNGYKTWIPEIEHSEKYDCEILVINETSRSGMLANDLTFAIRTDIDITDKYLPDVEPDSLLLTRPGQMFVHGLYICTIADFKSGYNFSPHTVTLGRDRQMLSSFDIKYQAGKIWNRSKRPEQVFMMLEDEAPDVDYLDSNKYHIQDDLAKIYERKYGDAIPVSSQADVEAVGGEKFRIVPNVLKKIIRAAKIFIIRTFGTPVARLTAWEKRWSHTLNTEALNDLKSIIDQMGGKDV